jgi:hypothetical protein
MRDSNNGKIPEKNARVFKSGAKSGALCLPADLELMIEAWPTLPGHVRAEILTIATAAENAA